MEITLVGRTGNTSPYKIPVENYVLESPSLIKLSGNMRDIAFVERKGMDLVLTLSSGKTVVLYNFYKQDAKGEHSELLLETGSETLWLNAHQEFVEVPPGFFLEDEFSALTGMAAENTPPYWLLGLLAAGGGIAAMANSGNGSGSDSFTPAEPDDLDKTAPDHKTTSVHVDPITQDNIINKIESEGKVNITGKVTGEYTSGDTVIVTVNGVSYFTTVNGDGTFDVEVDGDQLAIDSNVEVEVQASDESGNIGSITKSTDYEVDIDAPDVPKIDESESEALKSIEAPKSNFDSGDSLKSPVGIPKILSPIPVMGGDGTKITGTGEKGAEIIVTDAEGNIIGSTVVNDDGLFEVKLDRPVVNGEVVEVIAKDKAGNESLPVDVLGADTIAPEPPIVSGNFGSIELGFNSEGTVLTIQAEKGATFVFYDENGDKITGIEDPTNPFDNDGLFRYIFDPAITDGTKLYVKAVDKAGNSSNPEDAAVIGPDVAPAEPTGLNFIIDEGLIYFIGNSVKAEAGAEIIVYNSDNEEIGRGTIDPNGGFSIKLDSPVHEDKLSYTIKDTAGISASYYVVYEDTVAPTKPTDISYEDNEDNKDNTITFSGRGEVGSTITLLINGREGVWQEKAVTVDKYGRFSITLDKKYLKDGDQVGFRSEDDAELYSEHEITYVDSSAPDMPTNVKVGHEDGKIILVGKAEAGSIITLIINGKKVQVNSDDSVVNKNGRFKITLDEKYFKDGDVVKVKVTDDAGNDSKFHTINYEDTLAPAESGDVQFLSDNGQLQFKGSTEPGATIKVYDANDVLLGTGEANSRGQFKFNIPTPKGDETLKYTITDKTGNLSPEYEIDYKDTFSAKIPFEIKYEENSDGSITFWGKGEANSTIQVFLKGKPLELKSGDGLVDGDGYFNITFKKGDIKHEDELEFRSDDGNGNQSASKPVHYKDTFAPAESDDVQFLNDTDNGHLKFKGSTEPDATIKVYDANGVLLGTGIANQQGEFDFKISTPKGDGILEYTITDKTGNPSPKYKIEYKDTFAPVESDDIQFLSDNGQLQVKGSTEPGATIKVYDANGVLLGTKTANSQGQFKFDIPTPKGDETLKYTITDKTGNLSPEYEIDYKDTFSAKIPFEIKYEENSDGSITFWGKGEANSTIQVFLKGKPLEFKSGDGLVDGDGYFNVTFKKGDIKHEDSLEFRSNDGNGNQSASKPVHYKDTFAPEKPTIDFKEGGEIGKVVFFGTGEVGTTIFLYANGTKIGYGTVDENGQISIEVDQTSLKNGDKVQFISKDAAGNPSVSEGVQYKDTFAPADPVIYDPSYTNREVIITGKAIGSTSVTIEINGNKYGGSYAVNPQGEFEIKFNKQLLKDGGEIKIIAKDAAGNPSKPKSIFVDDKVAPEAPTIEGYEENADGSITFWGKGEANSTIMVILEGQLISSDDHQFQVSTEGYFNITFQKGEIKTGDKLTFQAKDGNNNISEKVSETTYVDTFAPETPVVFAPNYENGKATITGTAKGSSTVTIEVDGVTREFHDAVTPDGKFTITFDEKYLKDGGKLTVIAKDAAGNEAKSLPIYVEDKVAPAELEDIQFYVDDNGKLKFKGSTDSGAKIIVYDANGDFLGEKKADSNGKFNFEIFYPKGDGTLTYSITDKAGNESPKYNVDYEDLFVPTALTIEFSHGADGQVFFHGQGKADAKIVLYANSQKLGEGTVDSHGEIRISVDQTLLQDGALVKFIYQDYQDPATGNPLSSTEIHYSLPKSDEENSEDKVPRELTIGFASETDGKVAFFGTGGKVGSTISLYINGNKIKSGIVNEQGMVRIEIKETTIKNGYKVQFISNDLDPTTGDSLPSSPQVDYNVPKFDEENSEDKAPRELTIDFASEGNGKVAFFGTGGKVGSTISLYINGKKIKSGIVDEHGMVRIEIKETTIKDGYKVQFISNDLDSTTGDSLPSSPQMDYNVPKSDEENSEDKETGGPNDDPTVSEMYLDEGFSELLSINSDGTLAIPQTAALKFDEDVLDSLKISDDKALELPEMTALFSSSNSFVPMYEAKEAGEVEEEDKEQTLPTPDSQAMDKLNYQDMAEFKKCGTSLYDELNNSDISII